MITKYLIIEPLPVYTPLRLKVIKRRNIWTPTNVITDLVRVYYPIDMIEEGSDECPPYLTPGHLYAYLPL